MGALAALLLAVPTGLAIAVSSDRIVPVIAVASATGCLAVGYRVWSMARSFTVSKHDPLTGLPTQDSLARALSAALDSEMRRGALIYLDLDRFDMTNEALGRDAGDRLLADVAVHLARAVGPGDLLARVGGDEFAVFLPGVADVVEARAVAELIRGSIEHLRFEQGDHVMDVRASIGVATIEGSTTVSDVMRRGNAACRAAKLRGRDRIEVYRPALSEQAQSLADAVWTVRVKDALRDGRLTLVFQPITAVDGSGVQHYESLVRMIGPDGAFVRADEFIATAERCGLIRAIDRFVVRAALQRMAEQPDARCAINLSALSLHEDTLGYIREEIERSSVSPDRITFEITESAAVENVAKARIAIEMLRGIGCRFALDDFGKGLSSFAHLRYLPVDYLKIDGAFVRNLATDHVNRAMVRSMNELAHSLGIQTIAECVEDAGSLRALAEIGVDMAQGWHIGHPTDHIGVRSLVVPEAPRLVLDDFWPVTEMALPPRAPQQIVEFISFLDRLDLRARDLRDTEAIPHTITRPDDLDGVVVEIVATMRAQAEASIARGDETLTVRLPITRGLATLMEWTAPRMDMLKNLTRGGMVQAEWQTPLEIMSEFFVAACRQLGLTDAMRETNRTA